MADITVYQKPTCTTCKEVYKMLQESGVNFEAVDYYTDPIPKSKLKELLQKLKMTAEELVRKKEQIYQDLRLDAKKLSEEQWLDLMAIYPDLIQRPIIEKGEQAILARPAKKIKEFLMPPAPSPLPPTA